MGIISLESGYVSLSVLPVCVYVSGGGDVRQHHQRVGM